MGEYVRVESVEALSKFRTALCKFAETVAAGLDEAEAEIQRAGFWVKQEQRSYWKRQAAKRAELRARAKGDLNRKKLQKTALGGKFSWVDEEKALALAERRVEEARQKLANVRRWSRLLDEEGLSYQAVAQGMSLAVEADIPKALAQLDNMIAALEAYASSAAPGEQRSTAPSLVAEDLHPPEKLASMARGAPSPPGVGAQACRKLRARTPSQAVRDAAPLAESGLHWPQADGTGQPLREVLADLDFAPVPLADDDRIVVARGVWRQQRIYLERVESPAAGDSGWYVGFTDDSEPVGYDAQRVADFLAGRPDLEAVLELPAGCLVLLNGPALEAVLDAQDRLLGPPLRPP